jgi:hypothetical protein
MYWINNDVILLETFSLRELYIAPKHLHTLYLFIY